MTSPNPTLTDASGETVARAARYYRTTRYIIVAMLIGYGAWSAYDGFVRYPRHNAEDTAKGLERVRHPGLDIPFNRTLGVTLAPLGLGLLAWWLYRSRGEYRLSGDVVHVPGHRAVGLNQIRQMDNELWQRKGIAMVQYEKEGGGEASFKLDDFVYERQPIDVIHDRIELHLKGDSVAPAAAPAANLLPPRPRR